MFFLFVVVDIVKKVVLDYVIKFFIVGYWLLFEERENFGIIMDEMM